MINENEYIYVFVREDLSIPQQIVQSAHAVDEMRKQFGYTSEANNETSSMVLFGVGTEIHLLTIRDRLKRYQIEHKTFYEPDVNEHTAIATRPMKGKERLLMRNYKLLR